MSASFGGADALSFTLGNGTTTTAVGLTVIAGWWRPTTLAAGDTYWSAGATAATFLEVASTTSQLSLGVNCATTDGYYTTSDAGIVVNTWQFIAVAIQASSTSSHFVEFFLGTETSRPRLLGKTTIVAPSGNVTAETGLVICGGAIVGDCLAAQVSQVYAINGVNETTGVTGMDTTFILDRYITPMWEGRIERVISSVILGNGGYTATTPMPSLNGTDVRNRFRWMPFDAGTPFYCYTAQRETSATDISLQTVESGTLFGTPAFSFLEPAAQRRNDNPTSSGTLPLLMRR